MEHVGRAGKQRSAPMVTAKIGGPTGIEDSVVIFAPACGDG